jgi:hypothetical protein
VNDVKKFGFYTILGLPWIAADRFFSGKTLFHGVS